MNLKRILVSAWVLASVFVGAQGCTILDGEEGAKEERICTPGNNVFCLCADNAKGTKQCDDDGTKFSACTNNASRTACVGGEIEDVDTGKPVDGDGNVIDDKDAGRPGPVGDNLDTCPGKPTSVGPGQELVLEGDTTGAKDDAKGKAGACAAGGGGGDHVYRLTPTGSGALNVRVQGSDGLNPTVYLRTSCDDEAAQVACAETTGTNGVEQFNYNVVTGREYFLYVDAASGSTGKYKVTAKLATGSFCGDGKIDQNEACDDGNKVEDDGCSNNCKMVSGDPATSNGCPGQSVHVWPGQTVTGTGSTVNNTNTFTKTGTSCIVSQKDLNIAPDHVYEVTAHAAGNLVVTARPADPAAFDAVLVARRSCTDPTSQIACASSEGAGSTNPETMSFQVTNGQKVYVAVDGALNKKGAYTVEFKLQ